jgi:hypothetical protein
MIYFEPLTDVLLIIRGMHKDKLRVLNYIKSSGIITEKIIEFLSIKVFMRHKRN